jgi:hypothetical protein
MQFVRKYVATVGLLGLCALGACDAGDEGADEGAASPNTVNFERMGEDPDTTVAGPPTATAGCAIVDQAAVEQAVGFDVVMNDNTTGNCVLTPANGDSTAPAFDFRIEPRVSAFDYFSGQPDATPIAGLGERAVWATMNDMTGYVVIVSGNRTVVTAVAQADGLSARSRQQAEALARLILTAANTR